MAMGETAIKQAIAWIDGQLHDHPTADRMKLVEQASQRFDLSPLEEDFLVRHLAQRPGPTHA